MVRRMARTLHQSIMMDVNARVAALPWDRIATDLDVGGCAAIGPLLGARECRALVRLYADAGRFRSRIVMARHGFGQGEYQYFEHPLPDVVAGLRAAFYPRLAPIANGWATRLGRDPFPATLDELHARCRAAGQDRPTPLLLRYGPGDFNCLHQDVYGALVFPLQLTILLSDPAEFAGGEFVVTEQRPRRQSRVEVVPLVRGSGVIFAVRERPVAGTRGDYRAQMRHGVSR